MSCFLTCELPAQVDFLQTVHMSTHEDEREKKFSSILKTVVGLDISLTTINNRLKDGESFLWNGERIKFRYKLRQDAGVDVSF